MKAEELMTRDPLAVTPGMCVSDAVRIMQTENCGVVPVVADTMDTTIVGIITDRDIALRACQSGAEGPETTVASVMTTNLFCVSPDDDIARVREVMENAGVRRVPVIEEGNHLLGIISIKDLAERLDSRAVGTTDEKIMAQRPNNGMI